MSLRALVRAAVPLIAVACGAAEPGSAARSAVIGPSGGTFESEGLSLSVPAGALDADVEIRISVLERPASEVPGRVGVSRVYQIAPERTRLRTPATVTIAYDRGRIPAGIREATLDLRRTDFARAHERLASTLVDTAAGRLSGDTLGLGVFWATAPEGARPATVTLSPGEKTLFQGETVQLSAEVRDQSGAPMPEVAVTWTAALASVARVDATGLVTAIGPGVCEILAQAGSAQGKARLQVASTDRFPRSFVWENPLPQGNTLLAVALGGEGAADCAAGERGALLERGPQGWAKQSASTAATFRSIATGAGWRVAAGSKLGEGFLFASLASGTQEVTVPETELTAVWSDGVRGAAVGTGPNLARSGADGRWESAPSPVTEALLAAEGLPAGAVRVVGARGAVYDWSEGAWIPRAFPVLPQVLVGAAFKAGVAHAISETSLRRFDDVAGSWVEVPLGPDAPGKLSLIALAGERLLIAGPGEAGALRILVEEGDGFRLLGSAPAGTRALAGRSSTEIVAVGDRGAIARWDGTTWTDEQSGPRVDVVGLAAFAGPEVIAVGNRCVDAACWTLEGAVATRDASGAWRQGEGKFPALRAVAGVSATDVWAAADGANAYHWDGAAWEPHPVAGSRGLLGLAACADGAVYGVGPGGAYVVRDGTWTSAFTTTRTLRAAACAGSTLWSAGDYVLSRFRDGEAVGISPAEFKLRDAVWRALWASADGHVFVGGDARYVLQWDGERLQAHDQPGNVSVRAVRALWGLHSGNVWAAGELVGGGAFVAHFNGATWTAIDPALASPVSAMAGLPTGELWLGGRSGAVLHGVMPP